MSTETGYAFIGINPETHRVDVVAAADTHTQRHLKDMEGLLVIATSTGRARDLFGKQVDISDVSDQFTLGKAKTFVLGRLERSGTG